MRIYQINDRQLEYLQHMHRMGDPIPKVLWMHKGVDSVVAIDNTGDFWVEVFQTEQEAREWLEDGMIGRWLEAAEREVGDNELGGLDPYLQGGDGVNDKNTGIVWRDRKPQDCIEKHRRTSKGH